MKMGVEMISKRGKMKRMMKQRGGGWMDGNIKGRGGGGGGGRVKVKSMKRWGGLMVRNNFWWKDGDGRGA